MDVPKKQAIHALVVQSLGVVTRYARPR